MSTHFLLKEIHRVTVLGTVIEILGDDKGQPMVPIRSLCDAIGTVYGDEFARLRSDRRLGAYSIRLRAETDPVDIVCVPLTKLHAFLYTMNPDALDSVARAKLEMFQDECVDVLNDYWNKGIAINDREERGSTEGSKFRDARKLSRPALVEAVKRLTAYAATTGVELDPDDVYHHLITFCWDRLGRNPMKSEYEEIDTNTHGADSYFLALMERTAVKLIDVVIQEGYQVSDVINYLGENIDVELAKLTERGFELLEAK